MIAAHHRVILNPLTPPAAVASADSALPFVLFPVRIEARFANAAGGGFECRVRIYPDDLSIDTFEPELTPLEIAAGQNYWREVWPNRAQSKLDKTAWEKVLRKHKPERAAWMIRATQPASFDSEQPEFPNTPQKEESWSRAPIARLMPDSFAVVARVRGADRPPVFGREIPDPLPAGPNPSRAADVLDQAEVFDVPAAWMIDFEVAEEIGMAVRVPLSAEDMTSGIERLIVLGVKTSLGSEESTRRVADLFSAHRSTSGFAFLPQGTPTNNTPGAPSGWARVEADRDAALNLALGPAQYRAAVEERKKTDAQRLAECLGLPADSFARTARAGIFGDLEARAMACALWPATWGYYLEQMIGEALPAARKREARDHAMSWLRGRGPLPAFRVGPTPYGVLPCAAMNRWNTTRTRRAVDFERIFLATLRELEPYWSRAMARIPRAGAPGADPQKSLLGILGRSSASNSYGLRGMVGEYYIFNFIKFNVVHDPFSLRLAVEEQLTPGRMLLHNFGYQGPELPVVRAAFHEVRHEFRGPLIEDEPLSETKQLTTNYIRALREASLSDVEREYFPDLGETPNALLYLLLRHAALRTYVHTAVELKLKLGTQLEVTARDSEMIGFEGLQTPVSPKEILSRPIAELTGEVPLGVFLSRKARATIPELDPLEQFAASLEILEGLSTAELERLMTETLDTASHRFDAWTTSLATKRLAEMRAQKPSGVWIGSYGFLLDLKPTKRPLPAGGSGLRLTPKINVAPRMVDPALAAAAQPPSYYRHALEASHRAAGELRPAPADPSNAGYVLAPTIDRAVAAAVLRCAHRAHGDDEAFAVDLSSRRVRRALWILDGVRQGHDFRAVLGRRWERALHDVHQKPGDPELDKYIDVFRKRYPLNQVEAEGIEPRTITDGEKLARDWEDKKIVFGQDDLPAQGSPDYLPLIGVLDELADDVDAIGDLLLAESVFQAVRGHPDAVSAATDTLSGKTRPIEPEMIRTARGGAALTHRMVVAFSAAPAGTSGWTATPRALLEPALEKWAQKLLGPADALAVRVETIAPDMSRAWQTISISDLQISALDLVHQTGLESAGALDPAGTTEIEQRLLYKALQGRSEGTRAALHFELAPQGKTPLAEILEPAVRLRRILGSARSLEPQDFAGPDEHLEAEPLFQLNGPNGLETRATNARTILSDTISALENALAPFPADLSGGPLLPLAQLRAALLAASFLGVASIPLSAQGDGKAQRDSLVEQGRSALKELRSRHKSNAEYWTRITQLRTTPVDPEDDSKKIRGWLKESIAAVFGGAFQPLVWFAAPPGADLAASWSDATLVPDEEKDTLQSWFAQTARVRPAVGQLEILFLAAETAGREHFAPRVVQLPHRAGARWIGLPLKPGQTQPQGCASIMIHAPDTLSIGGPFCGLMIDELVERLPNQEETAGLSFHFDQPSARAPQAVLVAVPASDSPNWSWDDLYGAVEDVLLRARQRAVDLEDLDKDLGLLLPAMTIAYNPENDVVSTDLLKIEQTIARMR